MYLKTVQFQNFRGIREMEISFQPGMNLLVGDNGTGKTSVLDGIAIGLNAFLSGMPKISASGFQQSDFYQQVKKMTEASNAVEFFSPMISFQIDVDGKIWKASRRREDPSGDGKTITTGKEVKEYLQKTANDSQAILPFFSYMGISRVTSSKRSDYGKKIKNELNDRRCGYIGCMNSVPDKNSLVDWVKDMSYEAVLQGVELKELNLFQQAVERMMRQMNGRSRKINVRYSSAFKDLVYVEGKKEIPINYLSAGYQSLLWMTMDYAFRIAMLNPVLEDVADIEGIVLVDEIDMHLHPKWQWRVLEALKETFPKIQFILATHSPMIISSCKEGKLIKLNNDDEVSYLENAYGFSAEDVLTFRQESGNIPEKLGRLVEEFQAFLDEGKQLEAENIVRTMEDQYGSDNTEVKSARFVLEAEMAFENKEQQNKS